MNIWSHLLGFLLFFSLGVNDLLSVLPASGANREDYVIYAIGLFCFQVTVRSVRTFRTFTQTPTYMLVSFTANVRSSSVCLVLFSLPLFDVDVEQIHSLFHFTSPTTGASGVTGVVQVGLHVSQVSFSSESL